jgi:hypothetical protein
MHRSGTSFVASVLPSLGVSLGDSSRLMKPGPDNPAGYYEVQGILELNEELLARLGGAWDAPPLLDPGWEISDGLDDLKERATQIVEDTFGRPSDRPALMGFKDPRLSLLLPFWRSIVPVQKTIVLVRDPREVVASLANRKYAVKGPQAAGLWLRYVYAAAGNDPAHLLVRYSELFDALPETLRRIAIHLGVSEPDAAATAAARERLQPSLRHHHVDDGTIEPRDPVLAIAEAVWNDGDVRLDVLPVVVADAVARGWLTNALDTELLARARADVIAARETLRQRNRQLAALTGGEAAPPVPQRQPSS